MADRLVYKGGKTVVAASGEGVKLVMPKAGTYHKFPRWWNKKPGAYIECAIFRVKLDNGCYVRLIVPAVNHMTLEIRHDGYGNFTFPGARAERVAIVEDASTTLLVEYQFSKISGGKVLKRSIAPLPKPAVVEEVVVEEKPAPKRKRTRKATVKVRARDEDGQFVADDPANPDVNEAWVDAPSVDE